MTTQQTAQRRKIVVGVDGSVVCQGHPAQVLSDAGNGAEVLVVGEQAAS